MSKARQKGTRFENEVVDFLRSQGFAAQRTEFSSPHGDITGVPHVCLEAKNQREQRIGFWLDQATRSAERIGLLPVVIHKRRMRTGGDNYVTMTLATFCNLLKAPAK